MDTLQELRRSLVFLVSCSLHRCHRIHLHQHRIRVEYLTRMRNKLYFFCFFLASYIFISTNLKVKLSPRPYYARPESAYINNSQYFAYIRMMSNVYDSSHEPTPTHQPREKKRFSKGWKTILIYSRLFNDEEWYFLPRSILNSIMKICRCTIKTCLVTYDKQRLGTSEAVLFHATNLPTIVELRELRKKANVSLQRWAYLVAENPYNTPDTSELKGLFNLTITYKTESDVWLPYGRYVPLDNTEPRPDINYNYAAGKQPGAAWLVSHCGVEARDEYVSKLQQIYPVYVGGKCKRGFKEKMSKSDEHDADIKKHYKYYLAFENGFCKEYITEKYWDRSIENDVIPIVLGSGPYNYGPYGAIPGSFINVEWFSSVRELASYLRYLDSNDTAYNEYFLWKQKYKRYPEFHGEWPFPCIFLCKLCEIIHDPDYPKKSYDISKFHSIEGDCMGREAMLRRVLRI